MTAEPICEVCGARLPANAPGEPCPACLVRSAIGQAQGEPAFLPQSGNPPPIKPDASAMKPGVPFSGRVGDAVERVPTGSSARRFGDYELLEEIARGGMGVVYRARQVSLKRLVAVKVLLAAEFANETSRGRFRREAEAVASLNHPNIVSIYEVGEHEGLPYFSMELIEGRSLADLTREKPVPARQAARWLKTIAEAVHYAHQHGVLHRDLKPSNVLVDKADVPHVTDFGLAKRIETGEALTQTGQVLGTPSYMPPEQADPKHGEATAASDIYSLGAVLYHALTARPPFMAETLTQTLRLVAEAEPVSLRLLNPGVPRDLETICLKCLNKERERRYATAAELADELGRWLAGEPILARPATPAEKLWRWCRRNPALSATGAVAVLVAVLGLSGVLWELRAARRAQANEQRMRVQAQAAEQETRQELWRSYLAQARAHRWSPQAGRRFESLAALAKAAEIRPDAELRNEAIACMVLPDLRLGRRWPGTRLDTHLVTTDAALELRTGCELNREIFVRRLADDQLVRRFEVLADRVWFVRLSPDGRLVAAEFARPNRKIADLLCVWSVESGAKVWELSGGVAHHSLDFSPDSRSLAVADPLENIIIRDLTAGRERGRFSSEIPPYSLRFSPDGERLAVCSHRSQVVEIRDVQTGAVRARLPHPGVVWCAEWHPGGGMVATACQDMRVYLWDVAKTQQVAVLQGHAAPPATLAFDHSGDLLASGGPHDGLYLWEPLGAGLLVKLKCSATSLQFSPDGNRIAALGGVPEPALVEVARPKERRVLWAGGKGPLQASAAFSSDGRMLATLDGEGARLWDTESGHALGFVPFPEGCSILLHPDGRTLIGSGAAGLHRWSLDLETHGGGAQLRVGRAEDLGLGGGLRQAALNPDGEQIAVRRVRGIQLLRLDGSQSRLLPLRPATYESISFSPDGKWLAATACPEEAAKVWSVATGETVRVLPGSDIVNLSFSPDGHWLVTCSFEDYRFWEVGSWEPRRTISRIATGRSAGPIVLNGARTLMAAPTIASAGVRLLQTDTGQQLAVLDDSDHVPVCFSPGGGELITFASNGLYYIWDLGLIWRQLNALNLDWGGRPWPSPR